MQIDTSFDFRTDSRGRDPDRYSPTLRRYHQLLWSKPLPNGTVFDLDVTTPGEYLHHRSELGEFFLSSDAIIPTYDYWESMRPVIDLLDEGEVDAFVAIGYTMGGMIVFPGNRVDRKPTVNGARGLSRTIADRFDLTLECIRRHYSGEESPLGATLGRYADFFALFGDFLGYVDFFLLDDLVDSGSSAVQFFLPFDEFTTPSVPWDVSSYREYRDRSVEFVQARNRRIDDWVGGTL